MTAVQLRPALLVGENDAKPAAWAEYRFGVAGDESGHRMRHDWHWHGGGGWSSRQVFIAVAYGSPANTVT